MVLHQIFDLCKDERLHDIEDEYDALDTTAELDTTIELDTVEYETDSRCWNV